MNDMLYKAEIQHNEKTIQNLFRTQYYAFGKVRIIMRFLAGFVMIVTAAAVSLPLWVKGLMLLAGAWLVSTPDFPANMRADKVLQARKNNLPTMHYEFFDDSMKVSGEGSMTIAYGKITLLVHDDDYLYLFLDKNSVCMMYADKELMNFLETKTGLKFTRQKSLLAMNIDDLKRIIHPLP